MTGEEHCINNKRVKNTAQRITGEENRRGEEHSTKNKWVKNKVQGISG
jgi:hypothetical protein